MERRHRKRKDNRGSDDEEVEQSMERRHRKRKDNRGSDDEEIENNSGKRVRVSDAKYRKSMRRIEDRDMDDAGVLSEDSKDGRKGKTSKGRRNEGIMVTDDDMKHRLKKKEQEMNGSSKRGRRLRDDADKVEKIYAEEGKETVRKDQRFNDDVKKEKLERSVVTKSPVSSDNAEVESKTERLADANGGRHNVFQRRIKDDTKIWDSDDAIEFDE
ncbi:zinc finger CCCH domain-containing protein 13-like [Phalaenopsis equestris]|uniref:zinc finger CCCH domain-containing protein 13-like n=1 Tax=Phalaenopsis equestris TaxID=78828 RepID=UPI0009E59F99|nr:zinc finger CCCH domain-containing protein 13-like [Phalaenopsis equestris]